MSVQTLSLNALCVFSLTFILPSISAANTFLYAACSPIKYTPGTPYEYNINSILSSLVNSASSTNFNSFNISATQKDVLYGLYQCRGDLSSSDCRNCVAQAVSRVGAVCPGALGGALQFDDCFVKYDNVTFFGAEDKTIVLKKCGPSNLYETDDMASRDSLLGYLSAGGQYFRVGGSGSLQGVAQCVQDLSVSQCGDCLAEATEQLKSECVSAAWGDMFLGKCYVRYSDHGDHSRSRDSHDGNNNDDEMQKTLAILIGLIAGVALVIVFLSCLAKLCDKKGGGK